jgi:alanine racemase
MSVNYRQTWATIDLDALWNNYLVLSQQAGKPLIPVIKADAYGHGAKTIYTYLYQKGLRFFAVSLIEEAIELKSLYFDTDILVMGAILKEHFDTIVQYDLIFTVYDQEIFNALFDYSKPIRFHIKLDTGMHRYGLKPQQDTKIMIESLTEFPHLKYEGIYSHFATADLDDLFYQEQQAVFENFVAELLNKPKIIHVSNSSSICKHEKTMKLTTHARLGISLYGLSLDSIKPPIIPVMSLYTKIIQVKELKSGEGLGYGQTYVAPKDETIGLIPIGYADGWIRKNKGHDVIIGHKRYPLVGNICMDTSFVKIDSTVKKGDVVTLFGGEIKTDEIASRLETIHYEIVTNISQRVFRIYMKEGKMYDQR